MPTILTPYVNFRDRTKEAMEYYQSIFGGELTLSTFGEFGVGGEDEAHKIMHSQLNTPGGMIIMAADTPDSMEYSQSWHFGLAVSGDDEAEITGYWEGISAEAQTINEPLAKAPWGASFGSCVDKFGIHWMFNIAGTAA